MEEDEGERRARTASEARPNPLQIRKPSIGLEPMTPSLPWIAGRRTSVRVTRLEAQKSLDQTVNRPSAYDPAMRAVLSLMYPFRTSAA